MLVDTVPEQGRQAGSGKPPSAGNAPLAPLIPVYDYNGYFSLTGGANNACTRAVARARSSSGGNGGPGGKG